ncbi:hypothetical protein A2U01_0028343 [Trifolium medium]|uniref:Uncharacterized protein n=1 Tax=Trifolium medium TaxID=97028 RepID=A0A392P5F1_9FABA|nr:hypothetical protein [Trifolium medium]
MEVEPPEEVNVQPPPEVKVKQSPKPNKSLCHKWDFLVSCLAIFLWRENVNASAMGNGILFNGKVANTEEAVDGTKRVSWSRFICVEGRNKNLVYSNWCLIIHCLAFIGSNLFMLSQHLLLAD